jgi:hypothetical protein
MTEKRAKAVGRVAVGLAYVGGTAASLWAIDPWLLAFVVASLAVVALTVWAWS